MNLQVLPIIWRQYILLTMAGLWLSDYWAIEGQAPRDGGGRGVARLEEGGEEEN